MIFLYKKLSDVFVTKVVYYKENKTFYIYLSSKEIISYDILSSLREALLEELDYFSDIKIKIRYNGLSRKSNKDIVKKNWDNVLHILKSISPAIEGWKKNVEYMCIDDTLKIKIPKTMLYDSLKSKHCEEIIRHAFLEEFSIDLNVILEKAVDEKVDRKKLMEKMEREMEEKVREMQISSPTPVEEEEEKYIIKEEHEDENLIYGENVNALFEHICDIDKNAKTVCIVGEIFNIETKELKNGKILLIADVTDNTSSISCKLFLNDLNQDKVLSKISEGTNVRIKGDVIYDTFKRELTMTISGIRLEDKKPRVDKADKKRVELHAHTQMSSMDALCQTKKLVKQASQWGHKAIAITDHGVVQAFPEAMDAGKANGIKILYGVEGYLVEDNAPIIREANDKDLSQTFVVFDLETTGFSNKNDKITEIGAVKVKNFEIVDRFNELINPEKDISYKVQELTGITNDLIKDKPTIEEILPKFMEFVGDSVLVAHNAEFDIGFINQKCKEMNIEFKNKSVDTLMLARILLPHLKRFKLNNLTKELGVPLHNHHRAVDDAAATAQIFIKFLDMLQKKGAKKLSDVNEVLGGIDYTKLKTKHITLIAQNLVGVKNLYKIVSDAHVNHFYRAPRILKSVLLEHKEGIIVGSACEAGEVFQAVKQNKNDDEIKEIIDLYDYIEVMPIDNNRFMIRNGEVKDEDELRDLNRRMIEIAKKFGKIPVATGDVHFLEPQDEAFRRIIMAGQGFGDAENQPPLYLKTTEEMLKEFSYLGEDIAREVVIKNPQEIADSVDILKPIPDETYPPKIEGADDDIRNMTMNKVHSIYGENLPEVVQKRLDKELNSIINNGYAVLYLIAQKLVAKSYADGYLVGSRGSVGSSFVATMSDITEVNGLPPHYVCPKCKKSQFFLDGSVSSGADLPDKDCPDCGVPYIKDGHDIPFETFLGFEGDKEPDIDLNFSGDNQADIHKYTEVLFGKGYVFKAGTIGTVAEKTAYGFVKKYLDQKGEVASQAEIERLTIGCTGIKRTTGQHPGGIMVVPNYTDVYNFTPIQRPADDNTSDVTTTHFDYHSISGRLLKLDILGHDDPTVLRMLQDITGIDPKTIPLNDEKVLSLFTRPDALGVTKEELECEVGSYGLPEFGTKFVRQMLVDTQPKTFSDLVRISGLSHGTDVWLNNAQYFIKEGYTTLRDCIATRDDIMVYLMYKGVPPKTAFTIMESVRKGKGLTEEFEKIMRENNVEDWYIESCKRIKYMFPKGHAVAYCMMAVRVAYYKVYYPLAYYATYFTVRGADDFDADLICKGESAVHAKLQELYALGNSATVKDKGLITVLELAFEMYKRGFEMLKVDLYESDATKFQIVGNALRPPLSSLQGVGVNAAKAIAEARKDGEFISKEDLRIRSKVSKTVIETLSTHGCLKGMSETNQLSLF